MLQDQIIKLVAKEIPLEYNIKINNEIYLNFYNKNESVCKIIGLGSILEGTFKGIRGDLSFPKIEILLKKEYSPDFDFNEGVTLHTRQHGLIFNKSMGEGVYNQLPLKLETEQDLQKAADLVKHFIQQDAQPFFDYWQDIRDFLPFLETDDIVFIANDLFSGEGMRKKMIIWWLCRHPRYTDFKKERLKVYEDGLAKNPSDKSKENNYKDLLSFLKRLESNPPIYEWNEKYLIKKALPT